MGFKVEFAPHNQPQATGVCSFASWENRDLQKAIEQAFNVSPRERIDKIVVEREGIKAFFEPVNVSR